MVRKNRPRISRRPIRSRRAPTDHPARNVSQRACVGKVGRRRDRSWSRPAKRDPKAGAKPRPPAAARLPVRAGDGRGASPSRATRLILKAGSSPSEVRRRSRLRSSARRCAVGAGNPTPIARPFRCSRSTSTVRVASFPPRASARSTRPNKNYACSLAATDRKVLSDHFYNYLIWQGIAEKNSLTAGGVPVYEPPPSAGQRQRALFKEAVHAHVLGEAHSRG